MRMLTLPGGKSECEVVVRARIGEDVGERERSESRFRGDTEPLVLLVDASGFGSESEELKFVVDPTGFCLSERGTSVYHKRLSYVKKAIQAYAIKLALPVQGKSMRMHTLSDERETTYDDEMRHTEF